MYHIFICILFLHTFPDAVFPPPFWFSHMLPSWDFHLHHSTANILMISPHHISIPSQSCFLRFLWYFCNLGSTSDILQHRSTATNNNTTIPHMHKTKHIWSHIKERCMSFAPQITTQPQNADPDSMHSKHCHANHSTSNHAR